MDMEYENEEYEDLEEPEECKKPEEWLSSIIDSIDTIADLCTCRLKESNKNANTTEWTLECDKYTLTISLTYHS